MSRWGPSPEARDPGLWDSAAPTSIHPGGAARSPVGRTLNTLPGNRASLIRQVWRLSNACKTTDGHIQIRRRRVRDRHRADQGDRDNAPDYPDTGNRGLCPGSYEPQGEPGPSPGPKEAVA